MEQIAESKGKQQSLRHVVDALQANYQLLYASEIAMRISLSQFEKEADSKFRTAMYERVKLEVDNDFPALRSQAVISLYAALEVLITDIVIEQIANGESILKARPWSDIKISLGEFEAHSREERIRFVVEEFKLRKNFDTKIGLDRFEAVLESVGLNGAVEKDMKDKIYELIQVRNVIAHRNGVVDYKLVASCPWLPFKPGERFRISRDMYDKYWQAVSSYVGAILTRLETRAAKQTNTKIQCKDPDTP